MLEVYEIITLVEGSSVDTFAEWFAKRLRDALGDTPQADLLRLLKQNGFEMAQARLSHYMQGRNYPDPPVLKQLAMALEVSADWLLGLTDEKLPVADLEEMLRTAKGESRIDVVVNKLPAEKKQQVLQFAEYLLAQEGNQVERGRIMIGGTAHLAESQRIQVEARQWLDSIERTRGVDVRKEIERTLRDKGIFINSAS